MSSINVILPEDPQAAEQTLIRIVTDAYRLTPAWKNDPNEIAAIEDDIRTVTTPAALGLSPEFAKWESVTTSAGVVWEVDDDGHVSVIY